MRKNIHVFSLFILCLLSCLSFAGDNLKSKSSGGISFTENKGQLIDMQGNIRPDILYMGDYPGSRVYLRKGVISYVLSNKDKVMAEIHEEIEELEKTEKSSAVIAKVEEELKKKAIITTQRIDVEFIGSNKEAKAFGKKAGSAVLSRMEWNYHRI